jgi:hypothetical protein
MNTESYKKCLKNYLICRKIKYKIDKGIEFFHANGSKIIFKILLGSSKFSNHELANGKDYYPLTYKNEALLEKDKYYFIKPDKGSLGLGINVIKGDGNIYKAENHVIQEKIESLLYPLQRGLF